MAQLRALTTEARKLLEDDDYERRYPRAAGRVDGLQVGSRIPNQGSIEASLTDFEELPGVREVPMSGFDSTSPNDLYYATDDIDRCRRLADEIKESGRIDPLIVVVDKKGTYVLEGGHRLGALHLLGKKLFPAKVVLDLEDLGGQ